MLAALLIALAQAATGEPAAAPAPDAPAAQTEAQQQTQAQQAPVLHCRNRTPTGSHIPVRVCSTDAEERAMAERTQDEMLHRPQRGLSPEQMQQQLHH